MILRKHKGARNELRAIVWLLDQGYEVYRNISPHGLIDIIAKRDDETLLLDVKTRPDDSPYMSDELIKAGVKLLACLPDGTFRIISQDHRPKLTCRNCGDVLKGRQRVFCGKTCKGTFWRKKLIADGKITAHGNSLISETRAQ